MAQSTTIINAQALLISHGGTDVSGSSVSAEMTITRENSSQYTADGDWAFSLVGKRKVSGTLTGYYSETAAEFYAIMVAAFEAGTAAALILSPLGNDASGEEANTLNVFVTEMPYKFDSASADAIPLVIPFIGTGAVTRADVA